MIESVDSCLTCENLIDSLKCKKHNLSVEIIMYVMTIQ